MNRPSFFRLFFCEKASPGDVAAALAALCKYASIWSRARGTLDAYESTAAAASFELAAAASVAHTSGPLRLLKEVIGSARGIEGASRSESVTLLSISPFLSWALLRNADCCCSCSAAT
jgi:hypothetical protein